MRYGDGPVVECDVHVGAAPGRVWELVSDIEVPARFSPELRRVRWLDDPPAPGARFEGHNRNALLGEWRTVSYVTELAAPRTFAWAVVDPDGRYGGPAADPHTPLASWRFDLTPEDGGTRLRLGARLGPARSGLSLAIDRMPDREEALVRHRLADLRTGIRATLEGIKALAEQDGPATPR
ncbi:SRPBCC family protein [Micromonospora auratinigra]|uniref:Polyketide cyclase / dehydrase and lipid transport n=1 Tax=Micromonospora auratinigra TaxID=261654 RepID=A0A1A8Z5T7_9ACTN|nr:SRPBCC family protein [Micromonospora auratinigra]SBT39177.1 Polyketide cyclase / dehydrase and lipid transport [Micromonospora auratinigra]